MILTLSIICALIAPKVIGATESDLLPACNLVDYAEDCAKLGPGLYIKCSDQKQVDLATCLSIWHGSAAPKKYALPTAVTIITVIIVILLLIIGFWYSKLRKAGKQIIKITRKH